MHHAVDPPFVQAQAHFEDGQRHEACGRCAEAVECYAQAVALEYLQAHAPLSLMLSGHMPRVGVPPDKERALEVAEAGVRLGCADSKGVLAMLLHTEVEEHKARALALAQECAASGSCYIILADHLWSFYADGRLQRIEFAAEQQFAPAQIFMGVCCYKGRYREKEKWERRQCSPDKAKGIRLLKCAAGRGFIFALEKLQKWRIDPIIDVQIWDLAGQDVYTLSHAVHFSHRCLYVLLWKPFELLDTTMRRVSPWLESLCTHVPDAHIVLVASHCKTNIRDDEFLALSGAVEAAARVKVQELNDITRLEVDRLRTLLNEAKCTRQRLQDDYAVHARSSPEFTQKDAALAGGGGHVSLSIEAWAARAAATAEDLPRSLRTRAADVCDACVQEQLLCERLQQLLGIRNGARPDDREACKLTLHCKSVDSVHGHGVAELRGWLYHHCLSLPFMGEMISSDWTVIADVFEHFGDAVLSRADAIALARQHLPHRTRFTLLTMNCGA